MENTSGFDVEQPVLTIEQQYRQHPGINFSSLSALTEGPKKYIQKTEGEQEDSIALKLGSAVDCLLTQSEEEFHKRFYIMTASAPQSEMMLKYVHTLFETGNHEIAASNSGYKISADRVLAKYKEEGKAYFDALVQAKDKIVLSFEESAEVNRAAKELIRNPFTSEYFTKPQQGIEIFYQVPIYATYNTAKYNDIPVKCLLDIVKVDHNKKTITPRDLKTTSKGVVNFKSSFRSFKYYLQGAFYKHLLKDWAFEKGYSDYTIESFGFIVIGFKDINPPMIYIMSERDNTFGLHGGTDKFGNRVKGCIELINDLIRHKNENQFDYNWEAYDNNGEVMLDVF